VCRVDVIRPHIYDSKPCASVLFRLEPPLSDAAKLPKNCDLFVPTIVCAFCSSSNAEVSDTMFAHRTAAERSRQSSCRKFTRRSLLVIASLALLAGAWCTGAIGQVSPILPGRMPTSPLNPAKPQTYQEVLVFGLQAKLPSELAFVDSVVAAVESGQLPARLVDQTYFWARTHSGTNMYGRTNRPIIYFIPGLQARLNRLHINVDLAGGLP